jgi:hypothetical protein
MSDKASNRLKKLAKMRVDDNITKSWSADLHSTVVKSASGKSVDVQISGEAKNAVSQSQAFQVDRPAGRVGSKTGSPTPPRRRKARAKPKPKPKPALTKADLEREALRKRIVERQKNEGPRPAPVIEKRKLRPRKSRLSLDAKRRPSTRNGIQKLKK